MHSSAIASLLIATAFLAGCAFACPGGWYNASGVCVLCEAGRHTSTGGVCIDCEPGRYSAAPGMNACYMCPPGRHTIGIRSAACQSCDAGFKQPLNGQSNCTRCEAGRYASSAGSVDCLLCPAGTVPVHTGTACVSCGSRGWSVSGGVACVPCPDQINTSTPVEARVCALTSPSDYMLDENYSRAYNGTDTVCVCDGVMSGDSTAIGTIVVAVVVLFVYSARVLSMRS
jgi:hypothetical protein